MSNENFSSQEFKLFANPGATLHRGNVLLAVQKDNTVVQFDIETGEAEIVFAIRNTKAQLWQAVPGPKGEIYCCLSGARVPDDPYRVAFGVGGALLKVQPKEESVSILLDESVLQDPSDILSTPEGKLIVADFQGFSPESTGTLYEVDSASGDHSVIFSGEPLTAPVSATLAGDGSIYIANALLRHPETSEDDTGNVIRLDKDRKNPEIVFDDSKEPLGAIIGVCATRNENEIVVVRNGWYERSAILLLDVQTGNVKSLLASKDGKPRFFANQPAMIENNRLVTVDSYQKELIVLDIEKCEVDKIVSLVNVLGPTIGMIHAFETVESVSFI